MAGEDSSFALVEALAGDVDRRLGTQAPAIVYAWSRSETTDGRPRVVMFAKVHRDHRSRILEASGADGDEAYTRLVQQVVDYAQGPIDTPDPA